MHALFGRDFVLLVLLSFTGLLVLVLHLVAIRRVMPSTVSWRERLLLCVPPATPVIAWRAGHPVMSVLWTAAVLTYVVIRFVG